MFRRIVDALRGGDRGDRRDSDGEIDRGTADLLATHDGTRAGTEPAR